MRAQVLTTFIVLGAALNMIGCAASSPQSNTAFETHVALDDYVAARTAALATTSPTTDSRRVAGRDAALARPVTPLPNDQFYFCTFADDVPTTQATQPVTRADAAVPGGYWRRNVWHQMGYEGLQFGKEGLWSGFKTAFWDVENALWLTAAMGASVTIQATSIDNTIRDATRGHRALGDMDEPIQLLGHPGTHFAGAGALWLASALAKDMKQHEVAKSLGSALAVNGITTMALKVAANSTAPNGDAMAWPSGHTSSSFTVAAVLNEYYGPWVGIPSLALAGLVGYQRIDSRVHDFSDVVFGSVLGFVIGTSIARDEKARFPEVFGMTLLPYADPYTGASGLALMQSW